MTVATAKWFRGWLVVAAAFTVLFVAYGIQFSYGVALPAITEETGWTRAQLSLPYSVYVLFYSVVSFPAGIATDRFGPRRVIAVGAVLLAVGWGTYGQSRELWQLYLTLGLIAGLGMSATWVPCNATVVRWFERRRGLAIGVATAGGSVGNMVVPVVAERMVAAWDWRTMYAVVGSVGLVLLWLCAWVMVRDPELVGLTPDGDPAPPQTGAAVGVGVGESAADIPAPGSADMDGHMARRTRNYWLLVAIFGLTWMAVFLPFVHLASFAKDLGASSTSAALVVSAIGLGGMIGRVIVGQLSDRLGRARSLAGSVGLQVAVFSGFAIVTDVSLLYPLGFLFGFGYGGGVTTFPALIGDIFGRTHAGAIVGAIFATAGSTAAVGPYLAGFLYDSTGSYRAAFAIAAAANVISLLLTSLLPRTTQ